MYVEVDISMTLSHPIALANSNKEWDFKLVSIIAVTDIILSRDRETRLLRIVFIRFPGEM